MTSGFPPISHAPRARHTSTKRLWASLCFGRRGRTGSQPPLMLRANRQNTDTYPVLCGSFASCMASAGPQITALRVMSNAIGTAIRAARHETNELASHRFSARNELCKAVPPLLIGSDGMLFRSGMTSLLRRPEQKARSNAYDGGSWSRLLQSPKASFPTSPVRERPL